MTAEQYKTAEKVCRVLTPLIPMITALEDYGRKVKAANARHIDRRGGFKAFDRIAREIAEAAK